MLLNASLTKPTFQSSGFQIGTGCSRVSIFAHRDRQHRVGGDDDEEDQPDHPGGGKGAPESAFLGHVDFTSDQAVSHSPSASALSGPWTNPFLNCSSRRIVVCRFGGTSSSSTICSGVIPVSGCW